MMRTLSDALKPRDGKIPPYKETEMKLVLSLTGDVLAFRRCARQYGLQSIRGYAVAHATQEFVGTFAHRALNRAFKRYREAGAAPSDSQMVSILQEVKELLKEQRRRPHSWEVVEKVGLRVMRLNRSFDLHGVYARMVDTERTLQADDGGFVIEGKVDVIQGEGDRIELWDYKATRDPRRDAHSVRKSRTAELDRHAAKQRIADFTMQLRIYSHLHDRVHGVHPAACRLLFLNEIDIGRANHEWSEYSAEPLSAKEWKSAEGSMAGEEPGLFFSVSTSPADVGSAMENFRRTGKRILDARKKDAYPAPPVGELPDSQTCDACDLRFSCPPACEVHRYLKS